ncbi:MAG: alpha/beta fold hydrolase [Betaproteobacteria bacterium]|nr:alpha/beta fold hydrolase [Betaproteobacteria bacterium]
MKSRSVFFAVIGCLTLSSCVVQVSTNQTEDGVQALQSAPDFDAARAAADLAPDSALYTTQTFDWQDGSRDRSVPARLYLPVIGNGIAAHPVPLVVFSHGIGGSREGYKYLGRFFAANGYASLHLQHVGSDRQLWFGNPFSLLSRLNGAAQESEAINRVRDLSFALDQLLASDIGARVDRERIIAAGHSYGANTTMLAAGAQVERDGRMLPLRDARIKAAILLSAPPFYGADNTGRILGAINIPTLHITATDDEIVIPGYRSGLTDRLDVYQAMGNGHAAPKALAVFKGGSHSIFTDRMGTGGIELNPKVKAATRDLAVAFLNALFAGDSGALGRWQSKNALLIERFDQKFANR